MTAALTAAQANAVYDILVEYAGASEAWRENFVFVETDQPCTEYRFQGSLGFGGKFWRNNGAWYVTAYPENVKRDADMQDRIDATNQALAALRQAFRLAAPRDEIDDAEFAAFNEVIRSGRDDG